MEITKKYIKITENKHDKSNYIKISFGYELGGMNYFTGRVKPRGYYLTVYPVERGGNLEGFTAFSGVSECLHECTRKSAKAEKIASEKIPAYEKMMLDYIVNKYGYILEVIQ
jgi:hypothetical protein